MMPNDKAVPATIAPVQVAIIGTGTGDGGGTPITSGTVAMTPDHMPNLAVRVITPVVAIAVRFLNVYIGTVVGLLVPAMTSNVIPAPDFYHLLMKCAGLAVGGAVVLSLKDIVTIFARLEQKFPLLTGSV
jgi:hypothetical protein